MPVTQPTPGLHCRVSEILERKGGEVIVVDADATVRQALTEMMTHDVGAVVVVRGGDIEGIFTERDYSRRVALDELDPYTTLVSEVMSGDVCCVGPGASVAYALDLMARYRCRHLPVVNVDGRLIGIVSIGDCVALLSDSAARENGQLREYIGGPYCG